MTMVLLDNHRRHGPRCRAQGLLPLLLLAACSGPPERLATMVRTAAPAAAARPADEALFVGVEVCRDCHLTSWRVWVSSRHARSSVALHTELAPAFAARMGMPEMESYQQAPGCLGCHGVGLVDGQPPGAAGPGYQVGEGVTCEACHGPGGRHVEAVKGGKRGPVALAGLRVAPRDCLDCHLDKPSHAHERRIPYTAEAFAEKIRHGHEPETSATTSLPAAPRPAGAHPGGI